MADIYKNTFIEYAKDIIDKMHSWHTAENEQPKYDKLSSSIKGMHVYDSIIVFDKGKVTNPEHRQTGKTSY